MMKLMRKTKGSISIFLCLCLLPMVTYATLVIDVSRIQAARSMITGAGDLSMNAGLSEYEQVLERMYGLFAQVQSEEDLEPALKKYFKETIEASVIGSSADDSYVDGWVDELTDSIMKVGEDDGVELSNFLAMQLDEDSFKTDGVYGTALANPAVMKKQVVDYMKYKGPVSLANTFMRKIDFFKGAQEQANTVEKKIEYTETLKDMQDPCEAAYYAIVNKDTDKYIYGYEQYRSYYLQYQDTPADYLYNECKVVRRFVKRSTLAALAVSNNPFEGKKELLQMDKSYEAVQDYKDSLSFENQKLSDIAKMPCTDRATAEEKLKKLIGLANQIVDPSDKNGVFENKFTAYKFTYNKDTGASTLTPTQSSNGEKYYSSQTIQTLSTSLHVDGWIYDNLWHGDDETFDENAEKRLGIQKDVYSKIDDIMMRFPYYYTYEDIYDEYDKTFADFLKYYKEETKAKVKEDSKNEKLTDEEIEEKCKEYIKSENIGAYYTYLENCNGIQQIYSDIYKNYIENFDKDFATPLTEDENLKNVSDDCRDKAYGILQGVYQSVLTARASAKNVKEKLQAVKESMENVETAKNNWGDSLKAPDDPNATTQDINLRNDFESTTTGLEIKDVEDLMEATSDLITQYDIMALWFADVKYLGISFMGEVIEESVDKVELGGFPSVFSFEEVKNCSVDDGSLITTAADFVDKGVNGDASKKLILEDDRYYLMSIFPDDVTKLQADPDHGDAEKERFFKTLESIVKPKKNDIDSESESQIDSINEASAVDDDGNINTSSFEDTDGDSGGDADGDKDKASFDVIKTAMSDINNYANGYETQPSSSADIEGKQSSSTKISTDKEDYEDEDNKQTKNAKSSLSNATSILGSIANIANDVIEYSYEEEYFTEMFTCQTDPKYIKKDPNSWMMLNGLGANDVNQNTEWFGNEVEYLIWGGNPSSAATKNNALIFTIRFALNAIYAFTAPDIQSFALEVATAIAGWTVIGVPIVQACITIGIAMAESAYDLYQLLEGEDVVIIKNAATFVCSPTGALKEIAKEGIKKGVQMGTEYVMNKIDEEIDSVSAAADGMLSEYSDQADEWLSDFADEQTETVRSSIESTFVTPILNKLTPVLNSANSGVNSIEQNVNKAIDDAFVTIKNNIDRLPEGSIVKAAGDALKGKLDDIKKDVKEKITEELKNAKEKTSVEQIRDDLIGDDGIITNYINGISDVIEGKIKEVKDKAVKEISDMKDTAAGNLKETVHNKMDDIAKEVTGKATEAVSDTISKNTSDIVGSLDSTSSGGFTLNYKEYCKIFMFVQLPVNENEIFKRAGAVIEANVRNAKEEMHPNPNFKLTKANTVVFVDANVKVATLFPWATTVEENAAGGGMELDLSALGQNYVTIHYTGVNGY